MATVFSTKDPNPGAWFTFDETDPESGRIQVRVCNQEKRREIQKKCVKRKVEYKHGQRFEYHDTDDDLHSEMLWDYSIVAWEKLEDDDGKPHVCDTETKMFLMRNNVGFAQFVGQCIEKLNDEEENRVARLKKTSLTESSGSKKSPTVKPAKS